MSTRTDAKSRRTMQSIGGIFLLLFFVVSAVVPASAFAQNSTTADVPRTAEFGVNQLEKFAGSALEKGIAVVLINTIQFAVDRLAYDAAVFIASGGNASDPLFENRSVTEYFADYGAQVAGEAIGQLNEQIQAAGGLLSAFDLCAPRTPEILLSFRLGIKSTFKRPTPTCDINVVKTNWTGFIADIQSQATGSDAKNQLILTQLANMYEPGGNDFSAGIQLYSDILGRAAQSQDLMANKLIAQGPFKDKTNPITQAVETPGHELQLNFEQAQADPWETKKASLMSLFTNNDLLTTIGISAASTFLSTLISEGTQRLYDGFFKLSKPNNDPFNADYFTLYSSEDAQNAFHSMLTPVPLEITNYSYLSDFSACPSIGRGLYNCVADSSFISAVARASAGDPLTLTEAIDEGLVDGSFGLVSSADTSRDQDQYCYTYAFCASNLVKLRKARVIPIGWELAAESEFNSVDSPVTLKQAMDAFNTCNAAGEIDSDHPWCHLVDPNWVLKAPATTCKNLANGQLLKTSGSDQRDQECVDAPSCISEDDQGNCVGGYGYCVREENTWRFRGDTCPDYAATCTTVTDDAGQDTSFILNTVDYGVCSADNAGCLWYANDKEEQSDGSFAYSAIASVAADDVSSDVSSRRTYFNDIIGTCDSTDGGCATLVRRDDALRLNIVQNSSFEKDTDTNDFPDAWTSTSSGGVAYSTDAAEARTGSAAINPGTGDVSQEAIAFTQKSFYTLTYYAKQGTTGGVTAKAQIAFVDDTAGSAIDFTGTSMSSDCSISATDTSILELNGTPAGTDYERFTCTFTSPTLPSSASTLIGTLTFSAADVWIDDMQAEQGEDASDWHDAYNSTTLDTVVAKVPPSYLGCDGSATQPSECDNYAQVCNEQSVGCTLYTPTNGDPAVSGITNGLDACPATCVGYDTYKQEPTLYEPSGNFPEYFIPSTATSCSQEYAGCDEFTNETDESQNFFTYLRACVTPTEADANINSDNGATFYTWEGSDLTGYQLVTWDLIESNVGAAYDGLAYAGSGAVEPKPSDAPCTTWTTSSTGVACNDDSDADGKIDTDTADCDEHADIFTNPDCREFYDASGGLHYRLWSKTVTVNADCATYRKTNLVGDTAADQEANCTDSGGYYDSANGNCNYFGYAAESDTCPESENGCRLYTGGRSANSRAAFTDTFEDGDLTNWDAASATNVSLSNDSIATDGHSLLTKSQTVWTFLADNGSACTTEAGCAGSAQSLGGTCTVLNGSQYCGTLAGELFADKTYTLSFWAKGTGTLDVGFDFAATPSGAVAIDKAIGSTVTLETGWNEYVLGPVDMNGADFPTFGDGTVLVFSPTGDAYIDTVVLREGEDNIALVKDSWVTPAECDETPEGASSPQYYLGCSEYTTQDGDTADLKSFSSLCSEKLVGCDDFFQTHESDSAYAQTFNAECNTLDGATTTSPTSCYYGASGTAYDTASQFLCTIGAGESSCTFNVDWFLAPSSLPSHISYAPSTRVVPSDSAAFLVVNDAVTCSSDAAGCTEYGDVAWSQDRASTTGADSTYLLNLPDDYATTLCTDTELFCAEYKGSDGTTYEFKNPINQTCEYRTDVSVAGASYDGWFRTGLDEFCYGTCKAAGTACSTDADCTTSGDSCDATVGSYVIGGTTSGIWRNGDTAYGGWVGTCNSSYDSCSEFQDKADTGDGVLYGTTDGTPYFYLDNSSLDETSLTSTEKCNGQVSQKLGCVVFNDTTETSFSSNASATYMASAHSDALFGDDPGSLVDPIDCEADDPSITLPDGATKVNLCTERCTYSHSDVYDATDTVTTAEMAFVNGLAALSGTDLPYSATDMFVFGGSCYADTDCPDITSELGAKAVGWCAKEAVLAESSTGETKTEPNPTLDNDSNRVLKVDRDRQCSEWLASVDSQSTWDTRTNSFRSISSGIALCDAFSSTGDASFCSSWKMNDTATVLDSSVYSSRDTSWYGEEYSGYAIPDLYPVDTLTQVNTAPPVNTCDYTQAFAEGSVGESVYTAKQGDDCKSDADCYPYTLTGVCVTDDATDFRLALDAGECSEGYGLSCSVGYCENTGAACASTTACGSTGGDCIIGQCEDHTGVVCTGDTAATVCASGESCESGECVGEGEAYDTTFAASGSPDVLIEILGIPNPCFSGTYVEDARAKTGTCLNDHCSLTPDGQTFDVATSEKKVCRAYPEANSPFVTDIVTAWRNPDIGEGTSILTPSDDFSTVPDAVPYSKLSNFDKATVCNEGEDCDCTYKKVSFSKGAVVRYYNVDSSFPEEGMGICSGGSFDGAYCNANGVSTSGVAGVVMKESTCATGGSTYSGGGTCLYPTSSDTVLGLDGYCLERDSGINILGDRDKHACITWLPVDQLQGSTDLQAKYTGAGYTDEAYYCGEVNLFDNAYTLNNGCAEINGSDGSGPTVVVGADATNYTDCKYAMICPEGYFALGGPATVTESSSASDNCLDAVNACPYMCVPKNSIHASTGELCGAPSTDTYTHLYGSDGQVTSYYGDSGSVSWHTTGYFTEDYPETDTLFSAYKDCVYYGNSGSDELGVTDFRASADTDGDSYDDYYIEGGAGSTDIYNRGETYPGCQSLVHMSGSDPGDYNYAWTDRIANSASTSFTSIDAGNLTYTYPVVNSPFGKSISPTQAEAGSDSVGDPTPAVVAACGTPSFYGNVTPAEESLDPTICNDDTAKTYGPLFGNDGTAQAREYISWTISNFASGGGTVDTTEDRTDIADRLEQLFAKPLGVFAWSSTDGTSLSVGGSVLGTYGSEEETSAYASGDFDWDVRAAEGNPPKVWSLNTGKCVGSECEEGTENALTLNDANSGDVTGTGFYKANLKFYGAADKNQLPLRRIIVDWGDGFQTGSDTTDNFYKNHRGLQEKTTISICDTTAGTSGYEWGMNSESCDPNYFTYSHIYTCGEEVALGDACVDADGNGSYDTFPCQVSNQCVFQPKVHLIDNWGWCTGVCSTSDGIDEDGTEGCFEGTNVTHLSVDKLESECAYQKYPEADSTVDPWVHYDGNVIVTR